MSDLDRALAALRAADAAGNTDDARRLAAMVRRLQEAPAAQPEAAPFQRPVDALQLRAIEDARPMPPPGAIGLSAQALGNVVSDPARLERGQTLDQLRALEEARPGAQMPSQEQLGPVAGRTTSAAIEGGIMGAAPGIGAGLGAAVTAPLRYLARGMRARPEAQIAAAEQLAKQAATGIKDPRGWPRKLAAELTKAAGLPIAAGAASTPLAGPLGPLTGGGAAIVSVLMRMPPVTAELLANHPGFAKWALSTGASKAGATLGGLAGVLATAGPDVVKGIAEFLTALEAAEAEEAAAGAAAGSIARGERREPEEQLRARRRRLGKPRREDALADELGRRLDRRERR